MAGGLRFGLGHDGTFVNQFRGLTSFNSINVAVTPLVMLREDGSPSPYHGTGFFYRHGGDGYIITNWHNVTGKNPFTNELMDPNGFVPAKLQYRLPAIVGNNQIDLTAGILCEVNLYEHYDEPLWRQHRDFSAKKIDVIAIRVDNVPSSCCINEITNPAGELLHLVGHDIFIPGYPFRGFEGSMPPIWKRGSLASEPLIPVGNRPMFLVDAASRSGMSGSPVLRVHFGPKPSPSGSVEATNIQHIELIGVYSGHIDAQSAQITIGIGWYSTLINQIIEDGFCGTRD